MPYNPQFEKTLYNPKWLRDQYLVQLKSCLEIAKTLGTSTGVVTSNLRKHNIRLRTLSEAQRCSVTDRTKFYKELHNFEWLKNQYKDHNASEIARLVGCSVQSVFFALDKFGIPRKTMSSAKKGRSRSCLFGDGLSRSTLCNRANMTCPPGPCAICGNIKLPNVHHIDWDRSNNSIENLERLCNDCHLKHHRFEDLVLSKIYKRKTGKTLTLTSEGKLLAIAELGLSQHKLYKRARALLLVKLTKKLRAVIQETSERLQRIEAQLPYYKGSSL